MLTEFNLPNRNKVHQLIDKFSDTGRIADARDRTCHVFQQSTKWTTGHFRLGNTNLEKKTTPRSHRKLTSHIHQRGARLKYQLYQHSYMLTSVHELKETFFRRKSYQQRGLVSFSSVWSAFTPNNITEAKQCYQNLLHGYCQRYFELVAQSVTGLWINTSPAAANNAPLHHVCFMYFVNS